MLFKSTHYSSHQRAQVGVEYRLFFMDGAGHIARSHEYTAEDDAAAVKIATAWREGRKMELWQRTRMVKRWD